LKHNQRKDKFNRFYKSNWFIIWVVIYGILYYLSTLLITALGISNYYIKVILIGILISIIARAISTHIHNSNFKLNFNLFIWTLVYILLLFGFRFILSYFALNQWLAIIVIALEFSIFTHLIKKIPFEILAIICIIISWMFAALLYVNENGFDLSKYIYTSNSLSENSDLNRNSLRLASGSGSKDYTPHTNYIQTHQPAKLESKDYMGSNLIISYRPFI